MATVAGYSAPALSRAAAGDRFPTLDVTLAFVRACGGDEAEWTLDWEKGRARMARAASEPAVDAPGGGEHRRPGVHAEAAQRDKAAQRGRAAQRPALRRTVRLALVSVTVAGALATLLWALRSGGQAPLPATAVPAATDAGLNPIDGADPYLSRCGTDQVRVEQRTWPLYWPDGKPYGRLALYHSSACRASWGYVYGPNSATWTVVITDSRQGAAAASMPTSFRGEAPPDSWGNLLSDRTGCVHAEAYVVAANGRPGPTAMTSCWQESGPVYHDPAGSRPSPGR